MNKNKRLHPVRRVREILKNLPVEFGLEECGTAAGFAGFLECSASWIRNVECRATENWASLARRIEKKTNISAEWLMSNPEPDEPVLDKSGKVWNPIDNLDPLAASEGMPDWRKLRQDAPAAIPDLMSGDLRAMLIWELSIGVDDTLTALIASCKKLKTYKFSGLAEMRQSHQQAIGKAFSSRVYAEHKGTRVLSHHDLETRLGVDLNRLSTKDAAKILEDEGSGWILRLDTWPRKGPIIELLKMHRISRDGAE